MGIIAGTIFIIRACAKPTLLKDEGASVRHLQVSLLWSEDDISGMIPEEEKSEKRTHDAFKGKPFLKSWLLIHHTGPESDIVIV